MDLRCEKNKLSEPPVLKSNFTSDYTSHPKEHDHVMLPARHCWRAASKRSHQRAHNHVTTATTSDAHINRIDARSHNGTGPLAGKAIAIKDNITTSTTPTTAASKTLANHVSPFEATVVELLRQNGAAIASKTNLDEFGMGSHSQYSSHAPVLSLFKRNGVALSPGGSSGGSAVAVAADECWAALGTDTGGSVRLPAAYTGIVGFKPSYGLLSRWGVIQYANSLDTVGVLSRTAQDARTVFNTLNHHDPKDPTSLPLTVRERIKSQPSERSKSLRIGIPTTYNTHELSPAIRASYTSTLRRLQSLGHTLHPLTLPTTPQALPAYYVLAPAEASSNLAKYDGVRYGFRADSPPSDSLPLYTRTRGEGFGEEVQRRILLGAYTLSSEAMDNYFVQAQKVRRLVQRDFDRVFAAANPLLDDSTAQEPPSETVDVILTPTAPTLPPTVEEVRELAPVERYMNDIFTVPASLAGLPAASVPVALPDAVREGMEAGDVRTAGMQVIGQFGADEMVLRVAEIVEGM